MNTYDFIKNNLQLSAYISKVRTLTAEGKGEERNSIDAIYRILILCFSNCQEQHDESRRYYYTKHCYIPKVSNNREGITYLIKEWATIEMVNVEYWLRTAEVMIGDNKVNLNQRVINLIIENLNILAFIPQDEVFEITENF